MWSLEDLEVLNPADSWQDVSFLRHVLNISAASEDTLCGAAERLEAKQGPYVVAFAQLPFTIDAGSQVFRVNGWREGVQGHSGKNAVCQAQPGYEAFTRYLDAGLQVYRTSEQISFRSPSRFSWFPVMARISTIDSAHLAF